MGERNDMVDMRGLFGRFRSDTRKENPMLDVTEPLFTAAKTNAKERAQRWLDARLAKMLREGDFAESGNLTPELAELLLQRNEQNRAISQTKLDNFKRDITEGRWQFNGETIILAVTGHLNDGQHRCLAVIETGRPIRAMFVFGVTRESRTTVDIGRERRPGDLLHMEGIRDGNNVAAVAGYLWQIDRYGAIPAHYALKEVSPTKQERHEFAKRWLDAIEGALAAVPQSGARKIASLSQLAVAHILLTRACDDRLAVDNFIVRLVQGTELAQNDPIFVGRERLIAEKNKRPGPRKSLEIMLRAWNFHRRGQETRKIQLMDSWPKLAG